MNPHGLFSWTDIASNDVEAGKAFYSGLFGWSGEDQQDADGNFIYTMFSIDGKTVAGMGAQPPELESAGVPPMWNSYISVDSLDDALAAVEANGGTILMPAMEVPEAGRMAFVADPAGASFAMWQAINVDGAELFNDPGAMTWNELLTRNNEAARTFYGDLMGWSFSEFEHQPGYWLISMDNKVDGDADADDSFNGGILTMDDSFDDAVTQHWMVYFRSADTDVTANLAAELGGSVVVPPFDTPAGRIAVLAGPSGAAFSVISPPAQA